MAVAITSLSRFVKIDSHESVNEPFMVRICASYSPQNIFLNLNKTEKN